MVVTGDEKKVCFHCGKPLGELPGVLRYGRTGERLTQVEGPNGDVVMGDCLPHEEAPRVCVGIYLHISCAILHAARVLQDAVEAYSTIGERRVKFEEALLAAHKQLSFSLWLDVRDELDRIIASRKNRTTL